MRLFIILAYYMHYIALSILMLFAFQASNCGREPQREQIALIAAVKKGKPEKVSACLRQGADPNSRDAHGTPALHWACYCDGTGVITKSLLDAGASISAKDIDGWIPLDLAHKVPNVPAIKQLIQKAVDVQNLKIRGQDGKTLLHYAAALDDRESKKIVEQLLALSLDPNAQDHNGCTPLHDAIRNKDKDIKVVEMLLKTGALTNVKDNEGYTPLELATRATRKDVIVQLWLHGNPITHSTALK